MKLKSTFRHAFVGTAALALAASMMLTSCSEIPAGGSGGSTGGSAGTSAVTGGSSGSGSNTSSGTDSGSGSGANSGDSGTGSGSDDGGSGSGSSSEPLTTSKGSEDTTALAKALAEINSTLSAAGSTSTAAYSSELEAKAEALFNAEAEYAAKIESGEMTKDEASEAANKEMSAYLQENLKSNERYFTITSTTEKTSEQLLDDLQTQLQKFAQETKGIYNIKNIGYVSGTYKGEKTTASGMMAIITYEMVDKELQTTSGESNTALLAGIKDNLSSEFSNITYNPSLEAKATEIANKFYEIEKKAVKDGLTIAQESNEITAYLSSDDLRSTMYAFFVGSGELKDSDVQKAFANSIVDYAERGNTITSLGYITTQIGATTYAFVVFE